MLTTTVDFLFMCMLC